MKKTTQLLAAIITTTLTTTMIVSADNIDCKAKNKKNPPKHMLDKFDKDGDGALNENERNELKQVIIKWYFSL